MPEWDADIVVDEALVRALVAAQFPDLDAEAVRPVAEGWDNSVWVVDDRWAFRFPRRAAAAPLVALEVAILPRLAPLLEVAIPTPVYVGRPSDLYPWAFFGGPLLPGTEPADAGLLDSGRIELAAQLGAFLRSLHAPEIVARADPDRRLASDPLGRADMQVRVPRTRARLTEIEERGLWSPPAPVATILDEASSLPPPEASALVHGDLHFRHLLIDRGRLTGVVDWGDMCRADPSVDLLLYWSFVPPEGRTAFVRAYGPVPAERLLRARVLSLFLCAALLGHARHEGLPGIEAEALAGLERTLAD